MKQILQAKVNVLIENNRLQQQKKQQERLFNNKHKQKYSFSHYEEPSHKTNKPAKKESRLALNDHNDQTMPLPCLQRYATDNLEEIYQKRFNEVERKKYEKLPIEELRKEQNYFMRIIESINTKIDKITLKTIDKQLHRANTKKKIIANSLEKCRSGHQVQNENANQKKMMHKRKSKCFRAIENNSEDRQSDHFSSISREKSLNASQITQLNNEYSHLEQELKKYSNGQSLKYESDNLEIAVQKFEKEASQIRKLIKEKKKEITDLNADITANSKLLLKEEPINANEQDPKTTEELEALVYKKTIKNQERAEYLKIINDQNEGALQKIKELQTQRNILRQKRSQEVITTTYFSSIQTTKNEVKTPQCRKLKHMTTLEMEELPLEHFLDQLQKKKEVLLKNMEMENKKWKSLYTQKMKKLVSEYSNLKDISCASLKLQQKPIKEEEMTYWKGKTSPNPPQSND